MQSDLEGKTDEEFRDLLDSNPLIIKLKGGDIDWDKLPESQIIELIIRNRTYFSYIHPTLLSKTNYINLFRKIGKTGAVEKIPREYFTRDLLIYAFNRCPTAFIKYRKFSRLFTKDILDEIVSETGRTHIYEIMEDQIKQDDLVEVENIEFEFIETTKLSAKQINELVEKYPNKIVSYSSSNFTIDVIMRIGRDHCVFPRFTNAFVKENLNELKELGSDLFLKSATFRNHLEEQDLLDRWNGHILLHQISRINAYGRPLLTENIIKKFIQEIIDSWNVKPMPDWLCDELTFETAEMLMEARLGRYIRDKNLIMELLPTYEELLLKQLDPDVIKEMSMPVQKSARSIV